MTDWEQAEEAILRLHRGMQRAFEASLLPGEIGRHVVGTGTMKVKGETRVYVIEDGRVVWQDGEQAPEAR